jgi:hypothetical protein
LIDAPHPPEPVGHERGTAAAGDIVRPGDLGAEALGIVLEGEGAAKATSRV